MLMKYNSNLTPLYQLACGKKLVSLNVISLKCHSLKVAEPIDDLKGGLSVYSLCIPAVPFFCEYWGNACNRFSTVPNTVSAQKMLTVVTFMIIGLTTIWQLLHKYYSTMYNLYNFRNWELIRFGIRLGKDLAFYGNDAYDTWFKGRN